MNRRAWALVACGLALLLACGCDSSRGRAEGSRALLVPEEMVNWKPGARYRNVKPHVLEGGVVWGYGSIIGYRDVFTDFVLECDFLFDGKGEGGIQLRGNADARRSWEVGYELDIDEAPDRKHGHVHFPVNPKPYTGDAQFETGKWHTVRVEAKGSSVVVHLDGKKVLAFQDDEFTQGQICLQVEKDGVRYRNLRILPLK